MEEPTPTTVPKTRRSRSTRLAMLIVAIFVAALQVAGSAAPAGAQTNGGDANIGDRELFFIGSDCSDIPLSGAEEEIDAELCWQKYRVADSSFEYDEWLYVSQFHVSIDHSGFCSLFRCPLAQLDHIAVGHRPTAQTSQFLVPGSALKGYEPLDNETNCNAGSFGGSVAGFGLSVGGAHPQCDEINSYVDWNSGYVASLIEPDYCATCFNQGEATLTTFATSVIRTDQRPYEGWQPYYEDFVQVDLANTPINGNMHWSNF